MTLYRFLASKQPIPEVDHRAIQVLSEDEFKQLTTTSTTTFYFRLPEEPNKVIYVEDEAQLERLQIVKCNTFPEDTGEQIQRPYVYHLLGGIGRKISSHLVAYIRQHIKEEDKVEIWSIWHGEKVSSNQYKRLKPQDISAEDLVLLTEGKNYCIKFFSNRSL